ncbi:MAG: hypothetical protein SF162_17435 [bacterium]|nr:hypothetical protein [bacterium]
MTEPTPETPHYEPDTSAALESQPPEQVETLKPVEIVEAVDTGETFETLKAFETLSLADVAGRFFKRPGETLRLVSAVARQQKDEDDSASAIDAASVPVVPRFSPLYQRQGANEGAAESKTPVSSKIGEANPATVPPLPGIVRGDGMVTLTVTLPIPDFDLAVPHIERLPQPVRRIFTAQTIARLLAFASALYGGVILIGVPVQGEFENLPVVGVYWLIGIALWLFSEMLDVPLQRGWQPYEQPSVLATAPARTYDLSLLATRTILALVTVLLSFIALRGTSGNVVTMLGFSAWIASMIAVCWTFAPIGWTPATLLRGMVGGLRPVRLRITWVTAALVGIMLLGGYFRFTGLDTPPEMTSDHVEKIINAQEIIDGLPRVFFSNNGGREPIQMYLLALLAQVPLPELGINFHTLKLLSAIEGFLSIPVMFLLGRSLISRVDRRTGDLVGLAVAALCAVSYWHQVLSHLGLRIILTPLVMALLLIYLIRGLRTNDRSAFLFAGLTLGIGLYTYQAVRMMPLVVIVGFVIAAIHHGRDLAFIRRLFVNGVALVAVAVVCFVPMIGFISEFPNDFLQRTSTRIFGDAARVDADGNPVTLSLVEQVEAVTPQFLLNMRNAALGFNFAGDGAWFQNAPHKPFLDAFTGALLIVGLVAWVRLLFRTRDPGIDLWIPMIVIMLLPSALALAFPNENPSITRLSGALPGVLVLAGYGLVVIGQSVARMIGGKAGFWVPSLAAAVLVFGAYGLNNETFNVAYRRQYINSHYVYTEPGRDLRQFVATGGGWGNAYIIFAPYWWDHRGVAIEAGKIRWPHAIAQDQEPNRDHVPEALRDAYQRDADDEFRFDPNRPILFFYQDQDLETERLLQRWFPDGTMIRQQTYQPNDNDPYRLYFVPTLGEIRFAEWLEANGSPLGELPAE